MPLYELAVSPTDVSGAALRLTLNAPAPPPLASCRLHHPDRGALTLGVLGASHVITVDHPESSFSEEISCTTRTDGIGLPRHAAEPGYQLRSRSTLLPDDDFRTLARQLRSQCVEQTGWIGGAFPGDDAALTALRAAPAGGGWRWRTWHLYPGPAGGTVVTTSSRWQP